MNISKQMIINDWQQAFPLLTQYTSSTLFVKAGCVLLGLNICKDIYDEYRVFIECRPLWEEDKLKIRDDSFHYELKDNEGKQFVIPYKQHYRYFPTAVLRTKDQFGSILRNDIQISDFFSIIIEATPEYDKFSLHTWARLSELRMALALFISNYELTTLVKEEIDREKIFVIERLTKSLDRERFYAKKAGKNLIPQYSSPIEIIENLMANLYHKMSNRDQFLNLINTNCESNTNIQNLKEAHLIWKPEMVDIIRKVYEKQPGVKGKESLIKKLGKHLMFFCLRDKRF